MLIVRMRDTLDPTCPRCGGRHDDLVLSEFHRPPVVGVTLSHWALCPVSGEPIFTVRISERP